MITPPTVDWNTQFTSPKSTPIWVLALAPPHVPGDRLAVWRMEDASNSLRWIDSYMGLHDLDAFGGITSIAGKVGNAANFANNQYATVSIPSPGDIDFTWGGWVYANSLTGTIAGQEDFGYLPGWKLYIDTTTSKFTVSMWGKNGGVGISQVIVSWSSAASTGTWYFVVVKHDSVNDLLSIQVNNATAITTATSGLYPETGSVPLMMGANLSQHIPINFFSGRIDEAFFAWYLVAGADLTSMYNSGSGASAETVLIVASRRLTLSTGLPWLGENIGNTSTALDPINFVREAEINDSRFALSTLNVNVKGDNNTAAAVANDLTGYVGKLYLGFYDLSWSTIPPNYVAVFTGIVTEVTDDSGIFKITIRSLMAAAQDKDIFTGAATILLEDLNDVVTVLHVDNTDGFEPLETVPINQGQYISLDQEIFLVTGNSDHGDGTRDLTVTRYDTGFPMPPITAAPVSHVAGTSSREFFALGRILESNANMPSIPNDLHPMTHLRDLLLCHGKRGMGDSYIAVNDVQIEAARVALGPNIQFAFRDYTSSNSKTFIEEQIYKCCAAEPTEDNNGRIGIKLYPSTIAAVTTEDTLVDDNVLEFPKWVRNSETRINYIIWHLDYNPLIDNEQQRFQSTYEYKDLTLINAMGGVRPLEIWSRGIHTEFSGTFIDFGAPNTGTWFWETVNFLLDRSQAHIVRYGGNNPVIRAQCTFRKGRIELGDDMSCTFSKVLDMRTGLRDLVAAPFEVSRIEGDLQRGLITFDLFGYTQP